MESIPNYRFKNTINTENSKSDRGNLYLKDEAEIYNLKKENLHLKNIISLKERVINF